MAFLPLLNPSSNDEWIQFIGKYMLNMGAIETTTRMIIFNLNGTDQVKIYSAKLSQRLTYLHARYQKKDPERDQKAMKLFDVLAKHVKFRNAVAHSGIVYHEHEILGLLNLQPDNKDQIGEIISIEEMKDRVNESAKLGSTLLELQNDFVLKL